MAEEIKNLETALVEYNETVQEINDLLGSPYFYSTQPSGPTTSLERDITDITKKYPETTKSLNKLKLLINKNKLSTTKYEKFLGRFAKGLEAISNTSVAILHK